MLRRFGLRFGMFGGGYEDEEDAGGVDEGTPFKFTITPEARLRRFLVLGSEHPIYCAGRDTVPGLESVLALRELVEQGQGVMCVEMITEYATEGRVAKQDNLTFALAYCAHFGDAATRAKVYENLSKVCGIPTTLFSFLEFCKVLCGEGSKHWGRMHRRGVAAWYNTQTPMRLAMQVTKYANRKGWSHQDVLRLCHATPATSAHNTCFAYVCDADGKERKAKKRASDGAAGAVAMETEGAEKAATAGAMADGKTKRVRKGSRSTAPAAAAAAAAPTPATPAAPIPATPAATPAATAAVAVPVSDEEVAKVLAFFGAVDAAKGCTTAEALVALIAEHRLVREHCPTTLLDSAVVWEALLAQMPLMAMLRNLNKMTAMGLLAEGSPHVAGVVTRLLDESQLRRARIHPFNALLAMHTYNQGRGELGKMTWAPTRAIADALQQTFYKCFKNIEPTDKRIVFGLDVSGSMTSTIMGSPLSSREAAAALLMTCLRQCRGGAHVMAFSDTFIELPINAETPLEEVLRVTNNLPFQTTDCSLPMRWAQERGIHADAFVVITDNETNCGRSPVAALRAYRRTMGIADAKLVVFATANTPFTVADPNDENMLDIAGLDSNTPAVMTDFLAGKLM